MKIQFSAGSGCFTNAVQRGSASICSILAYSEPMLDSRRLDKLARFRNLGISLHDEYFMKVSLSYSDEPQRMQIWWYKELYMGSNANFFPRAFA